jgi:hypothetical protein
MRSKQKGKIDDILPQRGEIIKYIWNTTNDFEHVPYITPFLTCDSEYMIQDICYIPCYDRVMIIDDHLMWHWVPLYKFNFGETII